MSKLIILRGPSGAGKSTVAKILHSEAKSDVVLIEQDYYRMNLLNHGDATKLDKSALLHDMIESDTLIALKHGFDVILEGILNPDSYLPIFERVWQEHPEDNYMFYFDISLEETKRRHRTRDKFGDFPEEHMDDWYVFAKRSFVDLEVVILESNSIEQTVSRIREVTSL
jgi:adenylate kinase family enzyme